MYHAGKGRGAARLKDTGRFKRVKMEPEPALGGPSYESDPFVPLGMFMADANAHAGVCH